MKYYILSAITLMAMTSCSVKSYEILAKSDTKTSGKVSFHQNKKGEVELKMQVKNLTEGYHAVHLHEKGDCSAPDGSSAGAHWNPTNEEHGKWGDHQHHKGDIGNILADKNGNATYTFKTDKWCIGCADETKNIIGKSLIIHAKEDDFHTQPTGNAGGRVGCVEIK